MNFNWQIKIRFYFTFQIKVTSKRVKLEEEIRQFDVVLATDEPKHVLKPFSILLGNGFSLELKLFQKSYYLGFTKTQDNRIKNRFNLPLSELDHLKTAVDDLMVKHVKKIFEYMNIIPLLFDHSYKKTSNQDLDYTGKIFDKLI